MLKNVLRLVECGCTQFGCWPTPFEVTLTNVATNNTFTNVKIKKCRNSFVNPYVGIDLFF